MAWGHPGGRSALLPLEPERAQGTAIIENRCADMSHVPQPCPTELGLSLVVCGVTAWLYHFTILRILLGLLFPGPAVISVRLSSPWTLGLALMFVNDRIGPKK
jgi:hypothetical protein